MSLKSYILQFEQISGGQNNQLRRFHRYLHKLKTPAKKRVATFAAGGGKHLAHFSTPPPRKRRPSDTPESVSAFSSPKSNMYDQSIPTTPPSQFTATSPSFRPFISTPTKDTAPSKSHTLCDFIEDPRHKLDDTRQQNVFRIPIHELEEYAVYIPHIFKSLSGDLHTDHHPKTVIVKKIQNNPKPVKIRNGLRPLSELEGTQMFARYNFGPKLYGEHVCDGYTYLFLEQMQGNSLFELKQKHELVSDVIHQVHTLIENMASNGLFHKDLNLHNIFFDPDSNPHVRVIDFGMAAEIELPFDQYSQELYSEIVHKIQQKMKRDFDDRIKNKFR